MPRDLTDLEARLKPEVEPWQRVLLDAARIVRERGLAKGTRQDVFGRVCANGALAAAVDQPADVEWLERAKYPALCEAVTVLFEHVRDEHGFTSLARWNNQDERTAEEVASTFERVAGIGAMLGGR